jgi:hypothetical protein
MDISEDFLKPELLAQMLFAGRSVVIEPFTLTAHIEPLKQIFGIFYRITEFDPQQLSQLENFPLFLEEFEHADIDFMDSGLKPLLLIPNLNTKMLELLKSYHVLWLGIKKDLTPDVEQYAQIAFLNKKTGNFSHTLTIDGDLHDWATSIVDKIRAVGLDETLEYLTDLFGAAKKLCVLSIDFGKNTYEQLMKGYTPREQMVIRWFCSNYFQISLEAVLPPIEDDDSCMDLFQEAEKMIQTESIPEDPAVVAIQKELRVFKLHNPHHWIDMAQLLATQIPADSRQSPEDMYVQLRSDQWKAGLPVEFFTQVFDHILITRARNERIANGAEFVKSHYEGFYNAVACLPGSDALPKAVEEAPYLLYPEIRAAMELHNSPVLPVPIGKKSTEKNVPSDVKEKLEKQEKNIGKKKSTSKKEVLDRQYGEESNEKKKVDPINETPRVVFPPKTTKSSEKNPPKPTKPADSHQTTLDPPKTKIIPGITKAMIAPKNSQFSDLYQRKRYELAAAYNGALDKRAFLVSKFKTLKAKVIPQ